MTLELSEVQTEKRSTWNEKVFKQHVLVSHTFSWELRGGPWREARLATSDLMCSECGQLSSVPQQELPSSKDKT